MLDVVGLVCCGVVVGVLNIMFFVCLFVLRLCLCESCRLCCVTFCMVLFPFSYMVLKFLFVFSMYCSDYLVLSASSRCISLCM